MLEFSIISKFLIIGILAANIGGEAIAEEGQLMPHIECGDALPKGKIVHKGRWQRELVGPVVSTKHFKNLSEPMFIVQRYAIINRSKCWVSFPSFAYGDMRENKKRLTGTFFEVHSYLEGPGATPFGGRVGPQPVRALMAQVDRLAEECEAEYNRTLASLPKFIPLHNSEDIQKNITAVDLKISCLDERAKALDKRGFVGLWYSDGNDAENLFAVVDGELHVRMVK